MKIAVLGTGVVGRALAGRLADLGHDVTVGTRDPEATLARSEADRMGNPPFREWLAGQPAVHLDTFTVAAGGADLIVNATGGDASLEVLTLAGADNLAGKVLVDVSNPLDFSQGFPPTLSVKDTDSLGEQIQRAFPEARVVKTLNTMSAALMVEPSLVAGGEHTVFVSGDDAEAKRTVSEVLAGFGHRDVVDLGDITSARGAEMILPLWLRLMGSLGSPLFQFKVLR